ncbi:hypothetical protein [Streptomyces silvensis]|uniref:DUF3558 domain-containing protein n=1 Tax=Streptomyces silvensis TaxID=1765722 RepID=A0A0W7WR51_9ACTN|nr:hypothetical protein [Streptomyces silvensis]KUF13036.1 hypothetical protein AT728_37500 [Streptomyces silvensis]
MRLWGAVATVIVLSGGLVVWKAWPTPENVSAPARVCEESLPAESATRLLPKHGDSYTEYITGSTEFGAAHRAEEPPPTCNFTGGGRRVVVEYNRHLNVDSIEMRSADEARERVERASRASGRTPLALGKAQGYAWAHGAVLLLDCSRSGLTGVVEASVGDGRDYTSATSDPEAFAALAADTLRLAGQKVYHCEGSAALPPGAPRLGTPRGE